MNNPATADTWMMAIGKDFGGMSQGDNKTGQPGTNAMFVMLPSNIPNIPKDRVVTYARVVVDHRPQKADPNRIQITAGGNLISYPGELTTRTADITTAKLLWNSVLSMPGAKYMCLDIKNFYLSASLNQFKYMQIPFALFPPWIIEQYALTDKILNGHIYLEMHRAVWGLPQAGILANKLLKKCLAPHGYFECAHTPGLWKHVTRPISFTLVVDNLGVKYTHQEDIDHLIGCIKKKYELTEDQRQKKARPTFRVKAELGAFANFSLALTFIDSHFINSNFMNFILKKNPNFELSHFSILTIPKSNFADFLFLLEKEFQLSQL